MRYLLPILHNALSLFTLVLFANRNVYNPRIFYPYSYGLQIKLLVTHRLISKDSDLNYWASTMNIASMHIFSFFYLFFHLFSRGGEGRGIYLKNTIWTTSSLIQDLMKSFFNLILNLLYSLLQLFLGTKITFIHRTLL